MAVATIYNGAFLLGGVNNDRLQLSDNYQEPCCCGTGDNICWCPGADNVVQRSPDDILLTGAEDADFLKKNCKAVIDYRPSKCGTYNYYNASVLSGYLFAGGIYFCNTEWDNCNGDGSGCVGDNGAEFNAHMQALGCSLTYGRGTISVDTAGYTPLGNLFSGFTISGNATAEILGGTPVLEAKASGYCSRTTGGVCAGGGVVGRGLVVAFGDSNIRTVGGLRERLLAATNGSSLL